MKVILLTDVPKVGNKYDVKEFKVGYAQNVLLSKGLAELATPQALAKLEARKIQMNKKKEEEIQAFNKLISTIDNTTVKIVAKANEKGHLFKAINFHDIVQAIKENFGIDIEEGTLIMEHIKEVGFHTVIIKKGDRQGKCQVVIEAQK